MNPIMKNQPFGENPRVPLDLKSTINLPKTSFPMKANLPQNEPKILARWEETRLYDRIREARQRGRLPRPNRGAPPAAVPPTSASPEGPFKGVSTPVLCNIFTDAEGGVIDPDVFGAFGGNYLLWKSEGMPGQAALTFDLAHDVNWDAVHLEGNSNDPCRARAHRRQDHRDRRVVGRDWHVLQVLRTRFRL